MFPILLCLVFCVNYRCLPVQLVLSPCLFASVTPVMSLCVYLVPLCSRPHPLYVVSLCASLVLPVLFCQSFVLGALCSVLLPVSSVFPRCFRSALFPPSLYILCLLMFQGRRAEMLGISTSMPLCGSLKVLSRGQSEQEDARLPWSLLFFCRAIPCEWERPFPSCSR